MNERIIQRMNEGKFYFIFSGIKIAAWFLNVEAKAKFAEMVKNLDNHQLKDFQSVTPLRLSVS